jgi:hypothetical protein
VELVVEAEVMRVVACGVQIVPEGERRESRAGLPGRAECRRDRGATVESPRLVRPLEAAAAEPAEENVLTIAENDKVRDPVAIEVDGVGADNAFEVRRWIAETREPKRSAHQAVVPIERRRVASPSDVKVRLPVAVAIKDGDPAADGVFEAAAVDVVDARAGGLVDEVRRAEGDRRRPSRG